MKNSSHPKNSCPSQPDLSAWTDQQNDPDIRRHVSNCAECHSTVNDYRTIDNAIEKIICPPAHLVEKIRYSCRKSEKNGFLFGWFFSPGKTLKYAAVFALAGIAGWLATIAVHDKDAEGTPFARVSTETEEQLSANTSPETNREEREADRVDNPLENPESTPSEETSPGGRSGSTINPEDIAMADTSGASGPMGTSGFESSQKNPVRSRVKHVWAVDDPEQTLEFITRNLPGKTIRRGEIIRSTDKVILRILVRDDQLQDLVDRIQAEDSSLISSDLPQPGGSRTTFFTGNTVLYEADLVPRK